MGALLSKLELPDEAKEAFFAIYSKNKKSWLVSALLAIGALAYFTYFNIIKAEARKEYIQKQKRKSKKKKIKTSVDAEFISQIKILIKIAIPSFFSKEVMYMFILAFFLLVRTMLSIRIADINGTIVKAIVKRQFWKFVMRIFTLGSIAVPASFVNSWLAYFTARLALQLRTRLVHYFHDLYLSPMMYYKVSNIDSRIVNPDQALTETLTLWARSFSDLYANLTKPMLDIVLFSRKLAELMGWQGPGAVLAYYACSMVVIRLISPPFGTLAAITQRLEGNFRSSHHRLITRSEEIAFYGGHHREKTLLNEQYSALEEHSKYVLNQQFGMKAFNGFLQKYGSVMCGYSVLGLPVFGSKRVVSVAKVSSDITEDYIRNSSLLINLSKAIGRILVSYQDIQRIAGYTKMVSKLHEVLQDLSSGLYVREMVNPDVLKRLNLAPNQGQYTKSENIRFVDLSVVTPNGDILVHNINIEIRRGENLMIVGPNGCGKSSLFRMLGKLWPLWNGHLYAPSTDDLFYIPQKPYLCVGTFRDQVTYPDGYNTARRKGWTDEDLADLLEQVQLTYLLTKYAQKDADKRNADSDSVLQPSIDDDSNANSNSNEQALLLTSGWDTEENWFDVLSGGEKQRIAMARVFYHRPKFAILDECTSAVSADVEGYLYTHCKDIGITLITISHKQDLWKYHDKKLYMYGGKDGRYEFGDMVLPTQQQITCDNCGHTQDTQLKANELVDNSLQNLRRIYTENASAMKKPVAQTIP